MKCSFFRYEPEIGDFTYLKVTKPLSNTALSRAVDFIESTMHHFLTQKENAGPFIDEINEQDIPSNQAVVNVDVMSDLRIAAIEMKASLNKMILVRHEAVAHGDTYEEIMKLEAAYLRFAEAIGLPKSSKY